MSIGSSSGENRGREQDLWSLSDECTRTIRNAPMCPSSNSGVAFKKTDRSKAGRPHLRRNAPGATAASGSKGALKDMERCEIKRRTAAPPTTIFLINPLSPSHQLGEKRSYPWKWKVNGREGGSSRPHLQARPLCQKKDGTERTHFPLLAPEIPLGSTRKHPVSQFGSSQMR